MKQFSLEEYLKDTSKEVVTRDGRKARIICANAKSGYPVVALIAEEGSGREDIQTYTMDGVSYIGDQSSYDLFFSAPEKHEGWMNIYKFSGECSAYKGSTIWSTEEEAKGAADSDLVATVKIEWEE